MSQSLLAYQTAAISYRKAFRACCLSAPHLDFPCFSPLVFAVFRLIRLMKRFIIFVKFFFHTYLMLAAFDVRTNIIKMHRIKCSIEGRYNSRYINCARDRGMDGCENGSKRGSLGGRNWRHKLERNIKASPIFYSASGNKIYKAEEKKSV